jgi:hypothetical protein
MGLIQDFTEVKDLPNTAIAHASIRKIQDFEGDEKQSLPYASQDYEHKKLLLRDHDNEPTSVYANGYALGAAAWQFNRWPKANRASHDESEEVVNSAGELKKRMSIDILFWFQWMNDYHMFKQCRIKSGNIGAYNEQLVKTKGPTGAGAVLRATFLVSKIWKDVIQDDFHLDNAETKTWVRLDGDMKTEVNYSYDDPNVIAHGLGVMSKTFYEKQTFG